MSKITGEDEIGLHRILESLRIASILLLLLHFYLAFHTANDTHDAIVDRLTEALARLPVAGDFLAGKSLALLLLGISLIGASGKKSVDHTAGQGALILLTGITAYFGSGLLAAAQLPYIALCATGWLLTLYGGNYLSRVIWNKLDEDIFNRLHESFPQESRLLQNVRSVNLPAHFPYNGAMQPSWINFVSPQRGTMILGSPGCGKTAYVLQHFIRQMIQKGYSIVLHDFKYDDLSKLAYNCYLKQPASAAFYNIQFDDLDHSHRCNLLHPSTLTDISDAEESARALLLGMNLDWISKQGDFFVESAITFVKALIWYLRRYNNGSHCSWPHVIELAQTPLKELFTILQAEPQLRTIIGPFVDAMKREANEQLAGQIATATIGLSKLSSPRLYYMLTGADLPFNGNNADKACILTLGNNPQKASTYGPFISAYLNVICRQANKKGGRPLGVILEEFSTISVHTIDKTIATGRSNDIAVVLCLQNISQLKQSYGERFAEVVVNTCGNIISGQVTGDTAKVLAERFGRTLQHRQSLTATYADVQITDSHQLEPVIPESRIATLSTGEFVGMVADTPEQPIECKIFSCKMEADFAAMKAEEAAFKPLPLVQKVTEELINRQFEQIRSDIASLVKTEYHRIATSPEFKIWVIS